MGKPYSLLKQVKRRTNRGSQIMLPVMVLYDIPLVVVTGGQVGVLDEDVPRLCAAMEDYDRRLAAARQSAYRAKLKLRPEPLAAAPAPAMN